MGEELTPHDVVQPKADVFGPDTSTAEKWSKGNDLQKERVQKYLQTYAEGDLDTRDSGMRPEISGADGGLKKVLQGNAISTLEILRDQDGKVEQIHAKVDGSQDDFYFTAKALEALRQFNPDEDE